MAEEKKPAAPELSPAQIQAIAAAVAANEKAKGPAAVNAVHLDHEHANFSVDKHEGHHEPQHIGAYKTREEADHVAKLHRGCAGNPPEYRIVVTEVEDD